MAGIKHAPIMYSYLGIEMLNYSSRYQEKFVKKVIPKGNDLKAKNTHVLFYTFLGEGEL